MSKQNIKSRSINRQSKPQQVLIHRVTSLRRLNDLINELHLRENTDGVKNDEHVVSKLVSSNTSANDNDVHTSTMSNQQAHSPNPFDK